MGLSHLCMEAGLLADLRKPDVLGQVPRQVSNGAAALSGPTTLNGLAVLAAMAFVF